MTKTLYGKAIWVERSTGGDFGVPGTSEVEDWSEVRGEMQSVVRKGTLKGWAPWREVYRTVDFEGFVRWYFVNPER